jgi:hypothetical protein
MPTKKYSRYTGIKLGFCKLSQITYTEKVKNRLHVGASQSNQSTQLAYTPRLDSCYQWGGWKITVQFSLMLWKPTPLSYFNVLISLYSQTYCPFIFYLGIHALPIPVGIPWLPQVPLHIPALLCFTWPSVFCICFLQFDGNKGMTIFTCFCLFCWNFMSGFRILSSACTWCPT